MANCVCLGLKNWVQTSETDSLLPEFAASLRLFLGTWRRSKSSVVTESRFSFEWEGWDDVDDEGNENQVRKNRIYLVYYTNGLIFYFDSFTKPPMAPNLNLFG